MIINNNISLKDFDILALSHISINLNNLEKDEVVKVEDLVVVSCKCRSQWCEDCRVGHAVKCRNCCSNQLVTLLPFHVSD